MDQAVELLKYAVRCSVPPYTAGSAGYRWDFLDENTYLGDETIFRVKTERLVFSNIGPGQHPGSRNITLEQTAAFSRLSAAKVTKSDVTLVCRDDSPCVASAEGKLSATAFVKACDGEQATNIQIATDLLISYAARNNHR